MKAGKKAMGTQEDAKEDPAEILKDIPSISCRE
jgi:hypothetical protein